jgi:hypothetical protein
LESFAQRNLSLHLLPFETQPPHFCARAPLLLSLIVAIVDIRLGRQPFCFRDVESAGRC